MKAIFLLWVCMAFFCSCQFNSEVADSNTISALASDTTDFKAKVQPMLQKNCSPCHFPGGKLYERLPFDQSSTIIAHQAVILKRLKKEEDIRLIKEYVEQLKNE